MGTRQESALATRKKLIETSNRLISEKGFDAVSVEDITNACGVAKGTFYTYFKRKEDVVQELSFVKFSEIADHVREMDGTFFDKLSYYAVHFSACIEESGVKLAQQWTKNVIDPNSQNESNRFSKLAFDIKTLTLIFENSIENGELSENIPANDFVDFLIAQLYGQMVCWCMSDGVYSLSERTDRFCRFSLMRLLDPFVIHE